MSQEDPRKITLLLHSNAAIKKLPDNPNAPFGCWENALKEKKQRL
jgi:hypothetical protein